MQILRGLDRNASRGCAGQRELHVVTRPSQRATPSQLISTGPPVKLDAQVGLFEGMCLADIAHVIVCAERSVMPPAAAAQLVSALLALRDVAPASVSDLPLRNLHAIRESWLLDRTPAAGWLGVGRAASESTTTGYHICVRAEVLAFIDALIEFGRAALHSAEQHRTSVMPDYAYMSEGQPTTFGHYLLGFVTALLRDIARAEAFFHRVNRSPAGIGASNGCSLGLDRNRLALLLGFEGLVGHARDAMWQVDGPIEALAIACSCAVHLDRLAEDLMRFCTADFGIVALLDRHLAASKTMPQMNTDSALAFVRSTTNRLIGMQAAMTTAGRTPCGQMDNHIRPDGDVPRAFVMAGQLARLMGDVVMHLRFDESHGIAAVRRACAYTGDLAEAVMLKSGLDFGKAYSIAERLVRARAVVRDMGAQDAFAADGLPTIPTGAELDAMARATVGQSIGLSDSEMQAAIDPQTAVERRAGIGGTAAQPFAAMVHECDEELSNAAAKRGEIERSLARSRQALLAMAQQLVERT